MHCSDKASHSHWFNQEGYILLPSELVIPLGSLPIQRLNTSQSNEDGSEQVTPPAHVIVSEGVLALVAGSDTTATVAASTMYCLLRHPAALERLRAEVDKYYPPRENSLDAKHYPDMHYLEAVM